MSAPRNREIGFVSSSFSFRACRACRACGQSERGRMQTVIFIAGPPGCEYPGVVVSFRAPFCLVFVHRCKGFNTLLCFACSFDRFLCAGAWVLRFVIAKTLCFTWVLRFVIAKTLYFTWVLRFVIGCSSSSSGCNVVAAPAAAAAGCNVVAAPERCISYGF